MANSNEIVRYKQTIVSMIVNDEDIIELLDEKDVEYADDLVYINIFPYFRIPQTEQEQKAYILMYIDVPTNTNPNNLMKDIIITFVVACHDGKMKVQGTGGTRVDLLSAKVDERFNGSEVFGIGRLKLISNLEGNLSKTHPCRTLKFKIMDFDNKRNS